jgi:hypothetical protein
MVRPHHVVVTDDVVDFHDVDVSRITELSSTELKLARFPAHSRYARLFTFYLADPIGSVLQITFGAQQSSATPAVLPRRESMPKLKEWSLHCEKQNHRGGIDGYLDADKSGHGRQRDVVTVAELLDEMDDEFLN